MQRRDPLRIEVPKEDGVRFGRVGVIAIVGFGLGVLWPHLAGVRLVPSVPTDKAGASTAELSGAPADPASSAAGAALPAPEPVAILPTPAKEPFTVAAGEVGSCRNSKNKKLETCDPVDFDAVARGRIATLAACDAVGRADGVLSLGFELDFQLDRVTGVHSGKSTSLPEKDTQDLLRCLQENLGEVSLAGIRHEHTKYVVYYKVDFVPPKGPKSPEPGAELPVTPASGKATVAWDVALVRSRPARDAEVVARILQGTRVAVTGRKGDWYRIKYDAKNGEGWVFGTAIGM